METHSELDILLLPKELFELQVPCKMKIWKQVNG